MLIACINNFKSISTRLNETRMLGQLSEERILYRTRKTVLEMLRDRGYEIGDGEIEETFEEFEQRYLNKP